MASERVGDMTLEELKEFIREVVREDLRNGRQLGIERTGEEILASIRQCRQIPPASSTNLQSLSGNKDQ